MRPRHYAAENLVARGRCLRGSIAIGFNEAAALRRGKQGEPVAGGSSAESRSGFNEAAALRRGKRDLAPGER